MKTRHLSAVPHWRRIRRQLEQIVIGAQVKDDRLIFRMEK